MPDRRRHRGPHPDDHRLFGSPFLPVLRVAVTDYSWLLSHEYAENSALKLVGDRYQLTARQRLVVRRAACADGAREARLRKRRLPSELRGASICIDGYNVLIALESALSGAFVFRGRDGCYRDLASLHGTYRAVEETAPAVTLTGEVLRDLEVGPITWYLDAPVSNSGRLAAQILEISRDRCWDWSVELHPDPDRILATTHGVVATSDSWILDRCQQWTNLTGEVIAGRIRAARIVDFESP